MLERGIFVAALIGMASARWRAFSRLRENVGTVCSFRILRNLPGLKGRPHELSDLDFII